MNDNQRWTRAVMERDNWLCQNCGTTKHLDAAHIIGKNVNPALRHDVHNGVTLCRACHQFYHCFPSQFRCFAEAFQQGDTINDVEERD